MKKWFGLVVICVCASIIFLKVPEAFAASKKVELVLNQKEVFIDKTDKVTISGKTDKKATVKVNKKKVKVKSDGTFTHSYNLKLSSYKEKIEVVATLKGFKKNKQKVSIKIENNQSAETSTSAIFKDDNVESRNLNTKTDGEYLVGQDIPEGEYLITIGDRELTNKKNVFSGSYNLFSDSDKSDRIDSSSFYMEKEPLTKNGWFSKAEFSVDQVGEYSSHLVSLKNGQILSLDNTKAYPAEYRIKNDPKKLIEGMYKVGRDIPAGIYKTKDYNPAGGEELHTIRIMNSVDPLATDQSLIDSYQDYSEKNYPKELELKENQYIYFSDLILSKK